MNDREFYFVEGRLDVVKTLLESIKDMTSEKMGFEPEFLVCDMFRDDLQEIITKIADLRSEMARFYL